MSDILERLQRYTREDPEAAILFDESRVKGVSYAEMDDMSGRVYAWLRANGIGREDFVLINLPRGVLPVIAMIGVWKAGAAWALVEDTYAPERIAYIRKDCGCKLDISAANWDEIMRVAPLPGFEPADDHDAAYAIYTSGTTGNPKGVLHERGNLERAIQSIRLNGETLFTERDRLATLAPMNFVATVIVVLCGLNVFRGRNYIVSYATIKNPVALARFMLSRRITITFLTPSYVRMLGNNTGPFLRMLFVGSEPANNIYIKNVALVNVYAASESGFAVGVFRIDKPYETCPIGKPEVETRISLLGEDGREAADGETGELCFENPHVRGYINLPEETERAFVNGFYRTGDLARLEPDGNYVLLGRSGDMIKINGNRIEPAEIEAAIKQVLNIDWAAARGFEENGKSFLCAYYTTDVQVDPEHMRRELMKRLPYYMIPAYYIKIDSVPMKANGKMDRHALPAPKVEDFRNDYAAPTNDVEAKLCDAMAKVLKLSQVGIHDDFYEMGGDSLAAIELITECALPGLNAGEIFRGRTPEKIAALYGEQHAQEGDADALNDAALQQEHPLTTEQRYMVDYQFYTPSSTMYNLYTMFRVEGDAIDLKRLLEAMDRAIHNHPALLTTLRFNEDGDIVQRYTPEKARELYIEKLSDWEFHNAMKDTLVQPYQIIGGTLYRCRFFQTEKAGYVFFDVHHTVSDGTSMKVLLADVFRAYTGEALEKDYYYLMLCQRQEAAQGAYYEESRRYFEDRYDGVAWCTHPDIDHESRENAVSEMVAPLGIEQARMSAAERMYKISRNEFFIAVSALAIAVYNNRSDIKLSWIYNGRENARSMNTVGLLFRDLPVALRFRDALTLREVFADVRDQVEKGIEHSLYPYVEINAAQGVTEREMACVLYQRDIRDTEGAEAFGIQSMAVRQNQPAAENIMDIQILDGAEGLRLAIDFASSRYEERSIERFRDIFVKLAQAMAGHNSQSDISIGEIKANIADRRNIFQSICGIFSRKW